MKSRVSIVLALLVFAAMGAVNQLRAATRDTITLGVSIEPPGLDPTRSPSESIGTITYNNIYEGLTRLDQDGNVHSLLARAWTISDDKRVYVFELQANVRFHDGTPMDCDVVRFSLLRAGAPDSANPDRNVFTNIAEISCVDKSHVQVTLRQPHGSFLYELGWNDASIVSERSARTNATHPVGTGPFVFEEWKRGDHVTLRRNDDYWAKPAILKTAVFRFMPDPLAAGNALIAGELDGYPSFPSRDMIARFVSNPELRVVRGSFPFKAILALNNARSPFNDLRVRQAIAHAIDRKSLLIAVSDGDGAVIQSHMAPNDPDYEALPDNYAFDPSLARNLLAKAGIKPGTHLTLSYPPIGYARDTSELVAAYLEDIGFVITLEPLEWPTWLGRVFAQGAFDMTVIAHTEPHDIGIYDRDSIYFHYKSTEFHDLYTRYEAATDRIERHGLSVAMQKLLAHDEPNVFLYSVPRDTIVNRRVQGIWADQQIAACPLAAVSWAP